ncbi:oleoyl-acyl carrier protein thioesterase 2, chloroplastic-like isoform X2 [Elaeis guineensis]|uniref:Oleoyl-acyl carrier protein thioesterase 2, chloroplastic-like isoform X2 n=1 Tax=Elaeis guineensis var. tenera TaxID=51953 RepID=A0A6J0PEW1_ELAGV|nr:oleoyl-acyl carrier protein thioesterase 2, chloroplastic-like isoform X2 [Elaeis guineensis]
MPGARSYRMWPEAVAGGVGAVLPGEDGCAAVGLTATVADGGDGKGLAERLRLGSLVEDGLSYKESFIMRCYEVGINKTATIETIADLLQA